jgi:chemotaxis protein histidine kinase CheA
MATATATIGIKSSSFKRGLDEMQAMAQSWKRDIAGTLAGGFTFGAFLNFFNTFREEMGRVNDLSQRFGQTAQVIQQVGNVAKVSGTDIEQLASILTKLSLEAADSADKFAKVGINAQDFLGAGYDQQILMLAGAWERSNGSIQGQIDLMNLLGAKGQDILPMLSKGVAGLRDEFAQIGTVSDATITSIAALNDFIDGMTTRIQVGLGKLIEWGNYALDLTWAFANFGGNDEMFEKKLSERIAKRDTKSTAGMADPTAKAKIAEDAKKAADESKSIDEARASLEQKMQDLARSRMSDEEKITDLKREQAEQAAKAQDANASEKDRLKSAEEVVRVQKEIEAIQQRIQKSKDDEAKAISDLEGQVAAKQDEQKLDAMTPAARAEELKKRQKTLFDEATKAQADGDRKVAAEKRIAALDLADDIKKAEKEIADEKEKAEREKKEKKDKTQDRPGVVSSSLASIGGGGGVYVASGDPMLTESRRQTDLLSQIARNTGSGTGTQPSASPF